jgi:hypothetical protein
LQRARDVISKVHVVLAVKRETLRYMRTVFLVALAIGALVWITSPNTPTTAPKRVGVSAEEIMVRTAEKFPAEPDADPNASDTEIICRAFRKTAIEIGNDPDEADRICMKRMSEARK